VKRISLLVFEISLFSLQQKHGVSDTNKILPSIMPGAKKRNILPLRFHKYFPYRLQSLVPVLIEELAQVLLPL